MLQHQIVPQEADVMVDQSGQGAQSPSPREQQTSPRSPCCHHHCHHQESDPSPVQTDNINYVQNRASIQSMPQIPCTARTPRSLRRENLHQSLPRSPRLCSLSGMARPTGRRASTNSIIQVPLNTGDGISRPVTNYFGSSSRTLVGASANQPAPPMGGGKAERTRMSWRATHRTHNTDSMFSVLSAPSKISRSTTQHYILTPPSITSLPYTTKEASFMDINIKATPSRRGICNTVTIMIVIFVILFLFAGYPISLHVAKQMKENDVSNSIITEY